LLLLGFDLVVWTSSGRPCGGPEGLLQGAADGFSAGSAPELLKQHQKFYGSSISPKSSTGPYYSM